MEGVLDPPRLPVAHPCDGSVGRLCPRLLQFPSNPLILPPTVVQVSAVPELPGRRDSDVFDTEVDTEDCTVLGVAVVRYLGLHVGLRSDVEIKGVSLIAVL